MTNHNPLNERIKREYLRFLEQSKGQNIATTDSVAAAIHSFEKYTKYRDFKKFHYEQAIGYKKHLAAQENTNTGRPLSKSTLKTTLRHLKAFFQWLAMQPGFKSRMTYTDAEYFNLSEKDSRKAGVQNNRPAPTVEQVRHVVESMPGSSEIEMRDRALITFTLLTGARDSAIASFKLKHVDLSEGSVFQDGREVETKFSKTFKTYFFPVGDDIRQIVVDWVQFLRVQKLWGDDDPLFPRTAVSLLENQKFGASGLDRAHWSTANPIRAIFKSAFASAGLPYFNPHSFRKTLTRYGMGLCKGAEELKAWSQNLGHSDVFTTLTSYGEVPVDRQGEIISGLGAGGSDESNLDILAEAVIRKMNNRRFVV